MHLFIDADGSPRGYLAWYNHSTQSNLIRSIRPETRNGRFGVQRMEMLAIYFAIVDNIPIFRSRIRKKRIVTGMRRKRNIVVSIRSASKSTVEQLKGTCDIRDKMLFRICERIGRLPKSISCNVAFNYVKRTNNKTGLLLERKAKNKTRSGKGMIVWYKT